MGVQPENLTLKTLTRNASTREAVVEEITVEAATVGVVAIDTWNYHWCMTAAARLAAMVPRMNHIVECARRLGMSILWAPNDVASQYVGFAQRERALAVPYGDVPQTRELVCHFTVKQGMCMCGPGIGCIGNDGHDAIHEGLHIADSDWIVSGLPETYSVCTTLGLKHLIYIGIHTNACVFGKPDALRNLFAAGFACYLARDLTDAISLYDPDTGLTLEHGTAQAVSDLEVAGIPTVHLEDEMRDAGIWDPLSLTETVRMTPWGTRERPYFFRDSVRVTLSIPWLPDATIKYTLDDGPSTAESAVYEEPLALSETTFVQADAFRSNLRVSLPSAGYFVRIPATPPRPRSITDSPELSRDAAYRPDVFVDEITPMPRLFPYPHWFWHPRLNQSFRGESLRIRGVDYSRGLGMRSPANMQYELKTEYTRFVALAGVDDHLLDVDHGCLVARYPSIVFMVYIDGDLVSQSPVLRISQEPWPFDVPIARGSRRINLVAVSPGGPSPYNLADWVNAGFLM